MSPIHFVAAAPGWSVALPIESGTHGTIIDIWEDPIIAWAILPEEHQYRDNPRRLSISAFPITVNGLNFDAYQGTWEPAEGHMVHRPDGIYENPYVQTFETKEEVIAALEEERQQKEAYRQKVAEKQAGIGRKL